MRQQMQQLLGLYCQLVQTDKLLKYLLQIGLFAEKGSKRTCEHYGLQNYS